jgi:pyruvate ferredoxin oxidoreductase alpha subunit
VAALERGKAIGVIDRDYSFGSPFGSGVMANEIRAAMYNARTRPPLLSFICGLGGREVMLEDVYRATDMCFRAAESGQAPLRTTWLGVRE